MHLTIAYILTHFKKKKAQSNLDGGIKHERNYNYNTIISIYERKRISFNCKRLDP